MRKHLFNGIPNIPAAAFAIGDQQLVALVDLVVRHLDTTDTWNFANLGRLTCCSHLVQGRPSDDKEPSFDIVDAADYFIGNVGKQLKTRNRA